MNSDRRQDEIREIEKRMMFPPPPAPPPRSDCADCGTHISAETGWHMTRLDPNRKLFRLKENARVVCLECFYRHPFHRYAIDGLEEIPQ